jgi:hypothetical protein
VDVAIGFQLMCSLVLLCCFSFFTYRCSGKGRGVASGERDGGCAEVLGSGEVVGGQTPCKLGGLGSRERAGGRAEVLRRARMAMGGPVQARGSGERAGGRAEMLRRARSAMGRSPRALRAERGLFFSRWGSHSVRSARTI